jgi:hypothetical protein
VGAERATDYLGPGHFQDDGFNLHDWNRPNHRAAFVADDRGVGAIDPHVETATAVGAKRFVRDDRQPVIDAAGEARITLHDHFLPQNGGNLIPEFRPRVPSAGFLEPHPQAIVRAGEAMYRMSSWLGCAVYQARAIRQ